jgi:ribosomal-protein-alanine N-acetyltransferase
MTLDCGFFTLRPLQLTDKDDLVRYGNNKKIWRNMRDIFPHPYLPADAEAFVNRMTSQQPAMVFCIEYNNECVGVIGCFPQSDVYRKTAEIGYWLAEPFWSKGIMTTAVKKICEYVFENFDIVRIYAGVFEWNKPSMKVLEKAGFKYEGTGEKNVFKDGFQIDEHRYAFIKNDG